MPTTQTQLFPPPLRGAQVSDSLGRFLQTLQNLLPLRNVDTSAGDYGEAPPPPGLNATTGQSNQNQELIYKKTSSDGHTFTLTGTADAPLPEGPLTLTTQYDLFRIKSDGTTWWKVG